MRGAFSWSGNKPEDLGGFPIPSDVGFALNTEIEHDREKPTFGANRRRSAFQQNTTMRSQQFTVHPANTNSPRAFIVFLKQAGKAGRECSQQQRNTEENHPLENEFIRLEGCNVLVPKTPDEKHENHDRHK